MINDGFYKAMLQIIPNATLVKLEMSDLLQPIIIQNIDWLHTKADSKTVYEIHGNTQRLLCVNDNTKFNC